MDRDPLNLLVYLVVLVAVFVILLKLIERV